MQNPFKTGDTVLTKLKGKEIQAAVSQIWKNEVQVKTVEDDPQRPALQLGCAAVVDFHNANADSIVRSREQCCVRTRRFAAGDVAADEQYRNRLAPRC